MMPCAAPRLTRRRLTCLLQAALLVSAPLSTVRAQEALVTGDSSASMALAGPRLASTVAVWPLRRAAHALHDDDAPQQRESPDFRRADGWKLGGLTAVALLLSTADRRGDAWARRDAVRNSEVLRRLSHVGDVTGTWVSAGIGPAAWLAGRVRGDSGAAVLGLRTTEAVFGSALIVSAIKAISGRTRPYASADNSPSHWDLFGGRRSDSTRSFASGHSAMSAAAAVTLAAEWRRQGTNGWRTVGPPLAYALATLTAGSRVRDRKHWLSDVVSGAAVGAASALVVRRWHDANPRSRLDRALLRH